MTLNNMPTVFMLTECKLIMFKKEFIHLSQQNFSTSANDQSTVEVPHLSCQRMSPLEIFRFFER